MKLVVNWRAVLRRAWSIRLVLLAGLLSGAEVALPLFGEAGIVRPGLLSVLSFIATAGAFVARLIAQESVSGEKS